MDRSSREPGRFAARSRPPRGAATPGAARRPRPGARRVRFAGSGPRPRAIASTDLVTQTSMGMGFMRVDRDEDREPPRPSGRFAPGSFRRDGRLDASPSGGVTGGPALAGAGFVSSGPGAAAAGARRVRFVGGRAQEGTVGESAGLGRSGRGMTPLPEDRDVPPPRSGNPPEGLPRDPGRGLPDNVQDRERPTQRAAEV